MRMPEGGDEAGVWRIELSPLKPATRDHFLNVLQVIIKMN